MPPYELFIYILCLFFKNWSFVFFLIYKSSSTLHISSLSSELQIFKYVLSFIIFNGTFHHRKDFIFTYPNISNFLHSFQSSSLCRMVSPFVNCTFSILGFLASTFIILFFLTFKYLIHLVFIFIKCVKIGD